MLNGGPGLGMGGAAGPLSGDLDPAILQRSISAPPAPDHVRQSIVTSSILYRLVEKDVT